MSANTGDRADETANSAVPPLIAHAFGGAGTGSDDVMGMNGLMLPVERLIAHVNEQLGSLGSQVRAQVERDFERTHKLLLDSVAAFTKPLREASREWAAAIVVVTAELPRRSWYLSGSEPITLVTELAKRIRAKDWPAFDELLLNHVDELALDREALQTWLTQNGVPSYSIARLDVVMDAWETGNDTVATIVGVTIVDELCRCLYEGRDFTSKRGRQPRPQIGLATPASQRTLDRFAREFVQAFGAIHEDTDIGRLDDEDYFNRSAILHGQMRRGYGRKDAAKVVMLLLFLILGAEPVKVDEEGRS